VRAESTEAGVTLAHGPLALEIVLDPFAFSVRRGTRALVSGGAVWATAGSAHDQLIELTEGVIVHEQLGTPERLERAEVVLAAADELRLHGRTTTGRELRLDARVEHERVLLELSAEPEPLRLAVGWDRAPEEQLTGFGARHQAALDQSGRRMHLGADRAYTGPDCPPDMLDVGGIPMGDYLPVPWALSSAGYAVWLETAGTATEFDLREGIAASCRAAAGALRVHLLTDPTPAARLRRYCRLTGFPALLAEWGYGHWKSRDIYQHQDDVLEDFEGYEHHRLPLDAVVIDSPWATQYNTWRFNPRQFPDAAGMVGGMRAAGVRTVVWVAPWMNLDSAYGQKPPDGESERSYGEPAPDYEPAAAVGHFVKEPSGEPFVQRWWMGTGSPVDFTSAAAERWWRELARPVLELGVEGIKADGAEGFYFPPDVRFADGRTGARAAWAYPELYRRSMQRALDEAHPGQGVLFARSGWSGTQAQGFTWGGDQASDFWSLRALVAASLTAAASGYSNWSHDVGGYIGRRLVERCPKELLIRWVQFGCFSPLFHAHGRFRQEAWTYDHETLDLYREYVLLHERLVPYVRAAAATAARSGLPIMRPLCLIDPSDRRGFSVADAYGYGPALWVAPVLEHGAGERVVALPRGEWIDFWTGERAYGGDEVTARAPLERIPVWVRSGSILVTYPAEHVAAGLGDADERERPLEATLWGEPPLGRSSARLADGTRVRWRKGRWSVEPRREVSFSER